MRRIILSLLIAFALTLPAMCVEFIPKYKGNIQNYGIGLYFGTGKATVYEAPDTNSKVLAELSWDAQTVKINNEIIAPKNVFAVFIPRKSLSGFIVVDEQGTEFTKIIYNNPQQLEGWIKNEEQNKAFYWRQLFYKYGKTKGLALFLNTPKEEKILRLTPEELGETSYQFVLPKYIRLQLIKGNWALLKVVDYDSEQKVGWFKWRNEDGTLNMFPQFEE